MDSGNNTIGKYITQRELGRGAMGVVYAAYDPHIERTVAIKTLKLDGVEPEERQDVIDRFQREAKLAGSLSHTNIVTIHDYGDAGDNAYIVMEMIAGQSLKERMEQGVGIGLADAQRIVGQVLEALGYAHERGIVHRDIKPANIMLLPDGTVKVTDFGIARAESSTLTKSGMLLGTPSYMSPEQFMGQAVDPRSDLFSTGVLLYELLVGERPFLGNSAITLMHKVLHTEPAPPTALNVTLPTAVDAVVRKALAKRPDERFQTAQQFKSALLTLDLTAAQPIRAEPETTVLNLTTTANLGAVAAKAPTINAPAQTPVVAPALVAAPNPPAAPNPATAPDRPPRRWPRRLAVGFMIVLILGGLGHWRRTHRNLPETLDPAPAAALSTVPQKEADAPTTLSLPELLKRAQAGNTNAMNQAGIIYRDGKTVSRNYEEAAKWFRQAADLQHPKAMTNLAVLVRDGKGVPRDDAQAAQLLNKAAQMGEPRAMALLGHLYLRGRGVPQDDHLAAQWLVRSAESGDARAMLAVGELYEKGRGVTKDPNTAQEWFQRAAAKGEVRAQEHIGKPE